jgi:hypothetical protein
MISASRPRITVARATKVVYTTVHCTGSSDRFGFRVRVFTSSLRFKSKVLIKENRPREGPLCFVQIESFSFKLCSGGAAKKVCGCGCVVDEVPCERRPLQYCQRYSRYPVACVLQAIPFGALGSYLEHNLSHSLHVWRLFLRRLLAPLCHGRRRCWSRVP